MKKLLSLMLMLLMVFAVGCIFGGDDKDENGDNGGDGGSGSSAKAEEYLPLKVGATWNWKSTDEEGYTYDSTETITGTTTLGGKEYYIISEDDWENSYFRLANDILYMYMEEEFFAKAHAQGATFEGKEVPMFDFTKSAGKTWSIYSDSQSAQGESWSVTTTGKYVGLQSVTVPAGSFTNCAVFEITAKSQYSGTWGDEKYSGTYTSITTHYFAKGVGPVKIATKETDISNGEKDEYTETKELTYYSIPGGATGGDPNSGGGGGGGGTYNVSGHVKDSQGNPIEDVLITLATSGEPLETYTWYDGEYLIIDVPNGTYTLTPSKEGYTFVPKSLTITVSGKDVDVATTIIGEKS